MSQPVLGPLSAFVGNREDLAPSRPKRKKKRTAMKTKGRERSKNIEDRRSYFGSDAYDPDYTDDDRYRDFLRDAINDPTPESTKKRRLYTSQNPARIFL